MIPLPEAFTSGPLAHRALHHHAAGRIENSTSAVQAAIANGIGVEIDVQLSSDWKAMVFHDYTLARLTDASGAVRAHPSDTLRQIPLTGSTDTIPTLPDILELIAGQIPVLIELKDQDGTLGSNIGRLEQAVAHALQGYDGPTAVMSFNPHSVRALKDLAPEIPRGLTTCAFPEADWPHIPASIRDRLAEIPDYDTTGASFISHQHTDLTSPHVTRLKDKGAKILCWTIRSPKEEAEARQIAHTFTFEGYDPTP
ncbi:glycerophosphodiester phosphodiesterase family protein [Aestuariibius insulae]|uniref:glycerophosphodiester phosphodiesterase family protein n=1 Tax=Aestuariibius insulae TaxID=2058287 RepID=UPI00345E533B